MTYLAPLAYRTRVSPLKEIFEQELCAQHIATKLNVCMAVDTAELTVAEMEQEHFDVLGVQSDDGVVGYVLLSELRDLPRQTPVSDVMRPVTHLDIVTNRTPIKDLMALLVRKPWYFVLTKNRVADIVTRSDLQKSPVRMFLFGLVTLLEMYMRDMVAMAYSGNQIHTTLSSARMLAVTSLLAQHRNRNEDLTLVDCLQFCDKRSLLLKLRDITTFFQYPSKDRLSGFLRNAEKLRDRLSHAQDIVSGSTWEEVVQIAGDIESLLDCYEGKRDAFRQAYGHEQE